MLLVHMQYYRQWSPAVYLLYFMLIALCFFAKVQLTPFNGEKSYLFVIKQIVINIYIKKMIQRQIFMNIYQIWQLFIGCIISRVLNCYS